MGAIQYNRAEYEAGRFTDRHIVELVEFWQRHHGIAVDGYAGPNTQASIEQALGPLSKAWPLVLVPDGRRPLITSGFKTENPSRPTHDGVDLFYRWLDTDPDVPVGPGGAIRRNGKRRWWIPPTAQFEGAGLAVAAAAGVVHRAGKIESGWRCWVHHESGERTGYFHLAKLSVRDGEQVTRGQPLGVIGDSPRDPGPKHLHFEVSPVERYAPMNPRLWLRNAEYLQTNERQSPALV